MSDMWLIATRTVVPVGSGQVIAPSVRSCSSSVVSDYGVNSLPSVSQRASSALSGMCNAPDSTK